MKALIIGIGSIGLRRAKILKSLGIEVVICESNSDRMSKAADELNLSNGYIDSDRAIRERGAIDGSEPAGVCLICTPPSSHLELAQKAAGNGMHLFIEKPLSNFLDRKAIVGLVQKCQINGIITLLGQSYRFCPSLVEWRREFVDSVDRNLLYGSVNSGQHLSGWTPGRDYRQSIYADPVEGGIVLSSLAHSIDQVQWLFGDIEQVCGLIASSGELDIPVDDDLTLLLRMKSGAQVVIHNDFWQQPSRNEICVVTTGLDGIVGRNTTLWQMKPGDADAMYRAEMAHLVNCIEMRYQGQPDILQGILNLELMECAQVASDTGTWQEPKEFWKEVSGRK